MGQYTGLQEVLLPEAGLMGYEIWTVRCVEPRRILAHEFEMFTISTATVCIHIPLLEGLVPGFEDVDRQGAMKPEIFLHVENGINF